MTTYPTSDDYAFALERPAGRRPFKGGVGCEILDEINNGEIIQTAGSKYLHCANGFFAYVYKCRTQSGLYALRCLRIAPPHDIAARYIALTSFAQQNKTPYLVPCHYFDRALYASTGSSGGDHYPVLIMAWVEGKPLIPAVRQLALQQDRSSIRQLSQRWEQMMLDLERLGIVHGDLHPDNVHVLPNGELRLVDYDTIVVPGFTQEKASGAHCEGYVHPCYIRAGVFRDYHQRMDDFGALVVLLSLRALAYDPSLFGRFSQENILLAGSDIENPDMSDALQCLERLTCDEVSNLAHDLHAECRLQHESGGFLFRNYAAKNVGPAELDVPSSVTYTKPNLSVLAHADDMTVHSSACSGTKPLPHTDVNGPSSASTQSKRRLTMVDIDETPSSMGKSH